MGVALRGAFWQPSIRCASICRKELEKQREEERKSALEVCFIASNHGIAPLLNRCDFGANLILLL